MSGQIQFYLVAVLAVIILGLSKGGVSGLSSLAMPILSLVASPVRAAAIVLPILIVQLSRIGSAYGRLTFLIGVKLNYDAVLTLA
jgi:hypothetical protein